MKRSSLRPLRPGAGVSPGVASSSRVIAATAASSSRDGVAWSRPPPARRPRGVSSTASRASPRRPFRDGWIFDRPRPGA
jgi:hypothetical protein